MSEQRTKAPPPAPPLGWVALRGPSGRLYGYLDPHTQTLELKRKGERPERIALSDLLKR